MADTKTETPADEMRKAAANLRKYGAAALYGTWIVDDYGDNILRVAPEDGETETIIEATLEQAPWIVLTQPALAAPLASLLEDVVGFVGDYPDLARPHVGGEPCGDHGCRIVHAALAVARAMNGNEEAAHVA